MDLRINLLFLTVFCALGVGHGFVPRRELGKPHIIGGDNADISVMPYMASLRKFFKYTCSASIIGKYYVLSAAHCFMKRAMTSFYGVAVGSSHIYNGAQYFTAKSIFTHPKFNSDDGDYDVAVVRILHGFTFNANIAPIVPVNTGYSLNPNHTLVVSGWGLTSLNASRPSDVLLKTEVQYVDQAECVRLYVDDDEKVTDTMFCAGTARGDHDACIGDSGGPIVDLKSGKQVGIVSWGSDYDPLKPGVYTNLSHPEIRQFVVEITKKE